MANKITPEMQVQINELYAVYGVKSQVAKELGISSASVTKYLIPNYKPLATREIEIFDGEIASPQAVIEQLLMGTCMGEQGLLTLSKSEKVALEHLQKEEI